MVAADLLVLDTKDIVDPAGVQTVHTAKEIGQQQFNTFVKECILDQTKRLDEPIHRNKLPLFNPIIRRPAKGQGQVTSLKKEVELFARLYISCQTRDGNLEEFFRHNVREVCWKCDENVLQYSAECDCICTEM